jgi:hypothetical protein
MNRRYLSIVVLLCVVLAVAVAPRQAEAIPAFARQHKISCTTCHAPFPRLKDFGAEFAANGFALPEGENARDFVNTGDDELKLNKAFPIAARMDLYGIYEDQEEVNNDLRVPYGVKLLSGGTVAHNVGYYFYFYMSERGEVAGIEDAYIHFNNLFGANFDIMIGQFQTSDPLMKRELRLTFEDYEVYKTRVGLSQTNLAYDRGLMLTYDIEKTGTGLVGMIVNGNGKAAPEDSATFENDKYKNYGLRLSQNVFQPFRIGYFFYYGNEKGHAEGADDYYKSTLVTHGPDFTLGNGMFDLNFQYLWREDTNPTFVAQDTDVKTSGILAELVYSPRRDQSDFYFTLMYNQVDSDIDPDQYFHDYESVTISGTYLFARNLRGNIEYTRDVENEFNRVGLGLVSAF